MNIIEIIDKKKRGIALESEEIAFFVNGVTTGVIPEYQISALLMAILLKGMSEQETYYLTKYMAESGEQADLSVINGITVDKHSTGGVGDSTTFVVIPIVASLGLKVAKMSGRALGHTGGTIDKLETIPDFRTELTREEFINIVNNKGLAIMGQSMNICPADKKLYAIRDVTSTVDSIPLIASSIMSKKLAGGAETIVLDVKCGSGAFMQSEEQAVELGKIMVSIGKQAGRKITAVVTDMNEPLDNYIGNRLELIGALNVLKGEVNRLSEVSILLSALIVESALSVTHQEALDMVNKAIDDGSAYSKFIDMVEAQGGDVEYIKSINSNLLPSYDIISDNEGYINQINTKALGNILVKLGGGRLKLDDKIDYDVGLRVNKGIGDYVKSGDKLATMYYNDTKLISLADEIKTAIVINDTKPDKKPLVIEILR